MKRKAHAEARPLFARVVEQAPHFAGAYLQLATCRRGLNLREAAFANYRTHLTLKPDSAVSHSWVGRFLFERGQTEEALTHLHRAVELQPDHDGFREQLELARSSTRSAVEHAQDVFAQTLRNDASGSAAGLIWLSPAGHDLSKARAELVTHVHIRGVNRARLFHDVAPSLAEGVYPKHELRFDSKRGWWRLSILVAGAPYTGALGKNGVELMLLRQA